MCLDSVYFLIMTRIFNKPFTSFPLLVRSTWNNTPVVGKRLKLVVFRAINVSNPWKQYTKQIENQWIKNFAWTRCDIIVSDQYKYFWKIIDTGTCLCDFSQLQTRAKLENALFMKSLHYWRLSNLLFKTFACLKLDTRSHLTSTSS